MSAVEETPGSCRVAAVTGRKRRPVRSCQTSELDDGYSCLIPILDIDKQLVHPGGGTLNSSATGELPMQCPELAGNLPHSGVESD